MSRRKRMLEGLDQDIRDHIATEIEDNIGRGMSPEDARTAALRKFGNVTQIREETREVWAVVWWERLVQDLRFGLRMLRKSPGFTVVALLTLALGIGANAVVFSVMNGLVLRPLDVPQARDLYMIERGKNHSGSQSYPDYLDLRDRNRGFDGLAAFDITQVGLDTGQTASQAWVEEATGNYFDVLRIQPYLGRFFRSSDEHGPDSAPFVVLSYAYWHVHFQSDPGVVGRTVQLNKHPYTILGVTPPGFHGTLLFFKPDMYTPLVNQGQLGGNDLNARGKRWVFCVMGHLKPGVTTAQAIADLNSIGVYLEKTYPRDDGDMTFSLSRPSLYGNFLGPAVRAFVSGLMLLAGLILLAACANLGSLFAARAADRSRELALRLALGASRARILRQLFTEAVLISIFGGALGLAGAVVLLRWLTLWNPFPLFPINVPVAPDGTVYAVALLMTVASGFVFGAVPVRQVLHTDPYAVIKSGSTGSAGRRMTVRDLLLVGQIAVCAVLVTSSLVAVRGLLRSLHSEYGFDPHNTMVVSTDLLMADYRGDAIPTMQKRMLDALETIPGVSAAGLIDCPPLGTGCWSSTNVFRDDSADLRPANSAAQPLLFKISPGYFRADGTPLLSGRTFTWHDDKNAPAVAVINQEFARRIFGSVSQSLGGYFKLRDGTRVQVVGLVADGKYTSLTEDPRPAIFLPIMQSPLNNTWTVVRSTREPVEMAAAIKGKLRELDSGLPSFIDTRIQEMVFPLFPARMATLALGVLGAMGAMLSVTGIFGMAAYAVSKRMKELGIRVALGAQRKELLQAALGRAAKLLAIGSLAGLVLGVFASRVLGAIVYQATPRDPVVLAGVVLAMAVLGLIATWIPARRALAVDPLALLRDQ